MDGGAVMENTYLSKLITVSEGEWAGWQAYPGGDAFEDLTGPFYYRVDEQGPIAAFRAEAKHMNGGGYLHRGIAGRSFERRFQLAENVQVKGAQLENGLLHIDLERIVPEEKKPRRIAINGNDGRVIEAKKAA